MSTPLLSVVIPCLDDPDIVNTVASIRQTAGEQVQIVVVNDASTTMRVDELYSYSNLIVVTNRNRIGSGPSRHLGALYAAGEWLLHTDAHMRFTRGWYETFTARLKVPCMRMEGLEVISDPYSDIVFCATMLALEADGSEHGIYAGATLNVLGPDPDGQRQQVFEANWLKDKPEHGAEIPCVMGACYFVQRDWYLSLSPHRYLRSWGKEEEALSIKTWMAGGSVRYLKTVEIGHIFRGKGVKVPYEIPPAHYLYNKLLLIKTLVPRELRGKLIEAMGQVEPRVHLERAKTLIAQDEHIVAIEQSLMPAGLSFVNYCQKFGIKLP